MKNLIKNIIKEELQRLNEISIEKAYVDFYQKKNISKEDFDKIVKADPFSNPNFLSAYSKWMLKRYQENHIKLEDLDAFTEYFKVYDRYKSRYRVDWNNLFTKDDLFNVVKDNLAYSQSNSNIVIRKITNDDLKEIIPRLGEVFNKTGLPSQQIWRMMQHSDFNKSVVATVDDNVAGFYFFSNEQIPEIENELYYQLENLNGIEGVALGILKEYKNLGIGKKLIEYPKSMPSVDYIWGYQLKSLQNIDDWLKRREIYSENDYMYITYQLFNNTLSEKYKKKLNEDKITPTFVKDFLNDFGILISLNFSQVTRMGKDPNATKELEEMMKVIRKPIINGENYFNFVTNNINSITNNPKLLSALLKQVRELLIYIEPRIEKFVKDEISKLPDGSQINFKEKWLDRINTLKKNYKEIIANSQQNILEKLNEAINPNSKLFQTINTLKKDLINAAQKVYNQWEQDEEGHDEWYGSGGICDDIAEAMCDVINNKTQYGCFYLYNEYDCHTSIYVYDTENREIYNVDIPPYVYEKGTAYTWKKIPDVQFFERNVTIENRSYDYDDFIDEDGEVKENLY